MFYLLSIVIFLVLFIVLGFWEFRDRGCGSYGGIVGCRVLDLF